MSSALNADAGELNPPKPKLLPPLNKLVPAGGLLLLIIALFLSSVSTREAICLKS
jgi:hypothetical protein